MPGTRDGPLLLRILWFFPQGSPCSAEYDPQVVSPSTSGKNLERKARAGSFQVVSASPHSSCCLSITNSLVHHDDAIQLCEACKTWLKIPSEFKNISESYGGLHARPLATLEF